MSLRALKFGTAFFFFAATAVNLFHGISLAAVFSFLSGTGFITETLIHLYQTRPRPVRYPSKEGIARLRERLRQLRERKPSAELVALIAPSEGPPTKAYVDSQHISCKSTRVKIPKKRKRKK